MFLRDGVEEANFMDALGLRGGIVGGDWKNKRWNGRIHLTERVFDEVVPFVMDSEQMHPN